MITHGVVRKGASFLGAIFLQGYDSVCTPTSVFDGPLRMCVSLGEYCAKGLNSGVTLFPDNLGVSLCVCLGGDVFMAVYTSDDP